MFVLLLASTALVGAVAAAVLPVRERWLVASAAVLALVYMLALIGSEVAIVGPIVGGSLLAAWTVGVCLGRILSARLRA